MLHEKSLTNCFFGRDVPMHHSTAEMHSFTVSHVNGKMSGSAG